VARTVALMTRARSKARTTRLGQRRPGVKQ
jgi:hypothetical protein